MLTIETYIDYSEGKGLGLYASSSIPKGIKYWVRDERFDRIFPNKDLVKLDKIIIDYIHKYGFLEINDNWYLCYDNDRYCNHSEFPNTINHFDDDGLLIFCTTKYEIQANEEILSNYKEICKTCYNGVNY